MYKTTQNNDEAVKLFLDKGGRIKYYKPYETTETTLVVPCTYVEEGFDEAA